MEPRGYNGFMSDNTNLNPDETAKLKKRRSRLGWGVAASLVGAVFAFIEGWWILGVFLGIVFFVFLAKGKKAKASENSENLKKPLTEKLKEVEENSKQKIFEHQAKIDSLKKPPKKPPEKQEEAPPPDEELPEDSVYREVMARYNAENSLFHIEYEDYSGKKSSRDIEINSFLEDYGKLYIYAYCHKANDHRQFLVDRIVSITFDGNIIKNPVEFLWDRYKNSEPYKLQQALAEHKDEILALVFLARADGKMLKNERQVIGRYIDIIVPDIDAEAVDKMIQKTMCELAEFNKILKRTKSWGPDTRKLVMDAASQLLALKKQPDPMEQAFFEKLKVAIG